MNSRPLLAIISIVAMCSVCLVPLADSEASDAASVSYVLYDAGNGHTEWIVADGGSKILDVVRNALAQNGHTLTLSGSDITVDGLGKTVIGDTGTGGSLISPGTTGVTVSSSWHIFSWNSSAWTEVPNINASSSGADLAIGYYSDGVVPVETPDYKASWTTIGGDAELSFTQEAILNESSGDVLWYKDSADDPKYSGTYGASLYVQGHVFVKYGNRNIAKPYDLIECYDLEGNTLWSFKYASTMMDTSTAAVYGDRIYVQSTDGYIYCFDWKTGPGVDNADVRTFDGKAMDDSSVTPAPMETIPLKGSPYGDGFGSIVFDSGCLFVKHRNGMTYCFDTDLNLVWSYQGGGYNYFLAPTVADGYVFFGNYDGCLYALDKTDGSLIDKLVVYQEETKYVGTVAGVNVVRNGDHYSLFFSYSDGKGMSSTKGGYMYVDFDGNTLTKVNDYGSTMGSCGNYSVVVHTDDFNGIYVPGGKGLYKISADGTKTLLNNKLISNDATHAAPVLVNGKYLYYSTYAKLTHKIYVLDMEGTILKAVDVPVLNFCMSPVTVVDGYIFGGNDGGSYSFRGVIDDYHPPVPKDATSNAYTLVIVAAVAVAVLGAAYAFMKFGLKWEHPLEHIRNGVYRFLYGQEYTHSTRKKHRLWLIMLAGFVLTTLLAMLSLCVGSDSIMSPVDAVRHAASAISKGGRGLTYEELLIYNSRLPRTLAAFAVGIGLSVAGTVYQAVIKNPLVEPYIMGVSSGAGTFAVAVLLCDFTFFGLFPSQSPSLTIVSAMVGGLLAFALTMILSEKTGGKPVNYVLSGIIIGLVFGAVQSLMMVSAGNSVSSALSWLYGSFASMSWDKLWLVLIPCITLSLAPIVWAKEFNLVLLGEDQARQMGLDAHKFDMLMLILASVLTAFCVAFCGIIGFVGLVIPHLCRMIVGGDHRLVFPSAIAFGGVLMILADIAARALITGYELPVGAITTIIGVPVFAYLLIKRGKNYD